MKTESPLDATSDLVCMYDPSSTTGKGYRQPSGGTAAPEAVMIMQTAKRMLFTTYCILTSCFVPFKAHIYLETFSEFAPPFS